MTDAEQERYNQALREIEERHRKEAEGLEWVAEAMKAYCQVLRGERTDMTGLGEWRIICQNLEQIMGVKIIDKDQYDAMVDKGR